MIDLSPKHFETVQHILAKHVPGCEVRAFGSRAKWTAEDYSDLDLVVIDNQTSNLGQIRQLTEAFEESNLPIRVDVLDWHTISEEFKKIIIEKYVVIQQAGFGGGWVKLRYITQAIVDCEHKTAPIEDVGIPSIRTTDIKNGHIDLRNANKVSKETYSEWTKRMKPRPGDLILSREAPVGEVGIIPKGAKVCLGQRTVLIRPNREKVSPRYLLYLLLTREMQHEMTCRAEGSVVPHLNMSDIRDLEIPILPPLSEQRRIAHILGTLDDKIELNRQMNETLEATARAIFKSWFVDLDPVKAKMEGRTPVCMDAKTAALFPSAFQDSPLGKIPKGWKEEKVGNLVEIVKGRSYRSSELKESDVALVTLKSIMRGGGYRPNGLKSYTGKYKPEQVIAPGELVVSYTDVTQEAEVVGKPAIVRGDEGYQTLVASLDLGIIRPLESTVSILFLYCLFRERRFQSHIYGYANGTTVLHLSKDGIPSYQFAFPPEKIRCLFDSIAEPIFAKIESNENESRTLAQTRDTLLPKLLSGEVQVKQIEEQLSDLN
ncbi:MAG: restriction endonuclease subunit S [Candidatus Poribacteria bacterium]|nr:restriction endonuclease subunit S [Candidatus Poribacteria bacterium]MDE0483419.1 restriction endonuclease subunit S [Candidatus Poribacteria bacterium]